jgi:2-methylisocitrate lyase-like PEP mutase family enzyme
MPPTFRELHELDEILLLPNAWDAASARIIESAGARAIATTSAGVAWSRGYPDGNALPVEQQLAAVREIARVIRVPLTVDIEEGYSKDPAAVAQVAASAIAAGAAGINIEDGAGPVELLCGKIEAIRLRAAGLGSELFINARTDVFLRGLAAGDAAILEVARRGALYRKAGCDGLFVPGLSEPQAIRAIAEAIHPLPLIIMAVPGLPPLETLWKHGVRRLSAGSAIAQAALALTAQLATAFLSGMPDELFGKAVDYEATNELFVQ